MIRKSAQRFSEKIMLKPTQSAMTIHPNRIALWSFGSDEQNRSSEFPFLTRLLHVNRYRLGNQSCSPRPNGH
ncbi:hypothetical protein ABIA00_003723 [Bradyrhizobium ottawaense]